MKLLAEEVKGDMETINRQQHQADVPGRYDLHSPDA